MSRVRSAAGLLREFGLRGFVGELRHRAVVATAQTLLPGAVGRLTMVDFVRHLTLRARILEMGGPSQVFTEDGELPVYGWCAVVDNCNYQSETLWEQALEDGGEYRPVGARQALGRQFVVEGSAMSTADPYDVVMSSHMIEHTANPVGMLRGWRSLCVADGWLLLVLPHREATFDHRRPVTSLDHLLDDAEHATPESDTTHFEEILFLHDVDRDPGLPSHEVLTERLADNSRTRAAHHHVFNSRRAVEMVAAAGWDPVCVEALRPMNIFLLARNREPATLPSALTVRSPFLGDRG